MSCPAEESARYGSPAVCPGKTASDPSTVVAVQTIKCLLELVRLGSPRFQRLPELSIFGHMPTIEKNSSPQFIVSAVEMQVDWTVEESHQIEMEWLYMPLARA